MALSFWLLDSFYLLSSFNDVYYMIVFIQIVYTYIANIYGFESAARVHTYRSITNICEEMQEKLCYYFA